MTTSDKNLNAALAGLPVVYSNPMDFLKAVMNNPNNPLQLRIDVAARIIELDIKQQLAASKIEKDKNSTKKSTPTNISKYAFPVR